MAAPPDANLLGGIDAWLDKAVETMLDQDRAVPLFNLAQDLDALGAIGTRELRKLQASLRAQGFLQRALRVGRELDARMGQSDGGEATAGLRAELAVLSGTHGVRTEIPAQSHGPVKGRVLNVVGTSLPAVDSTYTRRTHSQALQWKRAGLEVAVASQLGFDEPDGYDVAEFDGVRYHRLPGPTRGSVPLDEWLDVFALRLSAVVRKFRPAAIVASSDFMNGIAARAVCRAYEIPFIYDVRGQWHDSWLSRQRDRYNWTDEQVPERWGFPDAWTLRRAREAELLEGADGLLVASAELLPVEATASERIAIVEDPTTDTASLSLFESIGAVEPGFAALAGAALTPLTASDVRSMIGSRDPARLDRVAAFGGFGSVRSIREEGWRHSSLEPVPITHPFDWINGCQDNRSQAFHLHAWDFMVPFLKDWDRNRNKDSLDWCLQRAEDWALTFNVGDDRGTMAWYDMAIGLRVPRLAFLLQEAVHTGASDDLIETLALSVLRHQQELFKPSAFNPHTNHGFYTAVGQLSFARLLVGMPAIQVLEDQGQERLRRVVATQFARDGGHLEHSPDYHRMLLASFRDAMDDGLLEDPDLADRILRAGEVMGWFIQPNRRIVQIGDSPARLVNPADRALREPHTQFLASGGRTGEPNKREMLALFDSGFAAVRSPQPHDRSDHLTAGYLTFMAGFHSRAHKHCDDLSITLFDQGREWLIDSGRFGYLDPLPADSPMRREGFFYGRPERQYVESVRAHNTAQLEGRDHNRRDRKPYGSALTFAEERDGHFRFVGQVDHGVWKHLRTVTYRPGSWLLVEDDLESATVDKQDFIVWWNLPGDLAPPVHEGRTVTFRDDAGLSLHVASLEADEVVAPVRGGEAPLRGWRAAIDYEFEPVWSLAHRVTAHQHVMRTLLSFGDRLDRVPHNPFERESGANARSTSGAVS